MNTFELFVHNIVKYETEYIHAVTVAKNFFKMSDEYIVALFHDLVEDDYISFDELKTRFNLNDNIMSALIAITRNKNEKYFDYIDRVKNNEIAKKVKLADLRHNISRCMGKEKYENLLKRYLKAKEILLYYNINH